MKNKLIELVDGLREELTPNAYIKISNAVRSLPDDQPDLLPFQWPVKEGYEVVTRDGRKVQVYEFKGALKPIIGLVEGNGEVDTWPYDGKFAEYESFSDLFLRRVEKKVWVVDYNNGKYEVYENRPTEGVFGSTHYEVTLKPVV